MAKLPTIMRDTRKRLQEGGDATDESISGQLGMTDPPLRARFPENKGGGQLGRQPNFFLDPFWDRFPL